MGAVTTTPHDVPFDGVRGTKSTTLSHWLRTLLWTASAALGCLILAAVERYGFRVARDSRVLLHPVNLAMLAFGYPHIVVALLFMLTSRRMSGTRSRVWFAGLLAAAGGIASVTWWLGGWESPAGRIFAVHYFVVHDFRDLVGFYKASGDSPHSSRKPDARLLAGLQVVLLSVLGAVLVLAALGYQKVKHQPLNPDSAFDPLFPAWIPVPARFAALLLPVLVLNAWLAHRLVKAYPGGWRAAWQEHLLISLGYAGIVLATLPMGVEIFYLLALAHFIGWYRHADRTLRSRPKWVAGGWNPLGWVRNTTAGFRTLHLGLTGLFVALFAVSAYGFARQDCLDLVIGRNAFAYWTTLHITLSFLPRS